MAELLGDRKLKAKAERSFDYVLQNADPDGYLGPKLLKNSDGWNRWPHVVFFRAVMAKYSATGDLSLVEAVRRHYLEEPQRHNKARDVLNVEIMLWAYLKTGDKRLLDMAEKDFAEYNEQCKDDNCVKAQLSPKKAYAHGVTYNEYSKLDSIPIYLRNRHEPDKISYKTPQLAHILDVTNGCIVYQEQVMQIFRELAGFSFGQADNVRRAMSKKKHAVMEAEREHFVHGCTEPGHECPGCVANGIPEQVANQIYDEMSSFASYAFNKSHAACYAYVAFQTAYLKCHYPSQFMAALLTSVLDNTDKVIEYSGECARLGIKVLPPDVNISNGGFTADDNGQIRFGLNAVKNVGRNLIENAVAERKEKPYTSLYDFCKRMHGSELNRRAVESLIKAGAFDCFGSNRHSMVEAVEGILKSIETDSRRNLEGQLDLFSVMSGEVQQSPQEDVYEIRPLAEYTPTELLQQEKEVSGLYLSGHPLDAYREKSARIGSHTIKDLTGEDAHVQDGEKVRIVCAVVKNRMMTTKSNSMMAFTSVEDLTGTMEVIVFPKVLDRFRDAIQENAVVVIDGRLSVREDEASKLLADSILPIDSYDPTRLDKGRPDPVKTAARRVFIRLPSRSCPQYDKVVNLLEIFDGDIPVILYLEDTKQKLAAPRRLYTSGHPLFFKELERLLGAENVATK